MLWTCHNFTCHLVLSDTARCIVLAQIAALKIYRHKAYQWWNDTDCALLSNLEGLECCLSFSPKSCYDCYTFGWQHSLGWPVQLLDVARQVAPIQPDVLDDVVLVLPVQVAQQGCNGALSWHPHAQSVTALWMSWVELLHHIIRIPVSCSIQLFLPLFWPQFWPSFSLGYVWHL